MDAIRRTGPTVWICLLLATATLAAYWPVIHSEFINYDDDKYVTNNPHVVTGLTLSNVRWAFGATYASNWHPLTWISHMLDVQVFGRRAGWHHLTSLCLHTVNALLLFLVLQRMTRATWRSAFVAALFALHPLHVESVAWIAERKDVLSACFFILTLGAYARYVESKGQSPTPVNREQASKVESAQPKVQVQGQVHRPESGVKQHAPAATTRPAAPERERGGPRGESGSPSLSRPATPGHHAARWYILALVFFICGLLSKPMLVTLPFVLLLLDYWPLRRQEPVGALVWEKAPFLLLCGISSLVTLYAQRSGGAVLALQQVPAGERVAGALAAYLAYLGKTVWPENLAVLYLRRTSWPFWEIILSACVIGGIGSLAIWQWRRRPWLVAGWFWFVGMLVPVIGLVQIGSQAMADRYAYLPHIGLFVLLAWGAGDLASRWRLGTAPLVALAAAGLGSAAMVTRHQVGCWHDSETLFTRCLAVAGPNHVAENNLGMALARQRRWQEAEKHFRASLKLDADYVHALNNLGKLLTQEGRIAEALPYVEKAAQLSPESLNNYVNAALAFDAHGQTQQAVAFYRVATRLDTGRADAFNNLAWILATHPEAKFRNGPEAVELARHACELTGHRDPLFVSTLAAAYAEAGSFTDAVATAEKARDLARAANQEAVVKKNEELLELYRVGKPYREAVGAVNR